MNNITKVLLILLVYVVIIAGVMAYLYQDQVSDMIQMAQNTITGMFGGEPTETPNDGDEIDGEVVSISVDATGAKLSFKFGEEFSHEGLKITATLDNGSTKTISPDQCRYVNIDTEKAGPKTVYVYFGSKSATYEITVQPRVIPTIPATPVFNMTPENTYRVEAEDIDMSATGVKLADGASSFVADAVGVANATSGNKYLTGFGVKWNYFGFTFTAAEECHGSTIVLKIANSSGKSIDASIVNVYFNFNQDDNGVVSGRIPLEGYLIKANGACKWDEIVLRNVNIPVGTNTLTFEVMSDGSTFDIDYIDFYAAMPYVKTLIEVNSTNTIIRDLEALDTDKIIVDPAVVADRRLQEGQLYIETVNDNGFTHNGSCLSAVYTGSQISTTLYLEQDATISFNIKAGFAKSHILADNFVFYIDGVKITTIEYKDILGASWWDWKNTNIGVFNLSAGYHTFIMESIGDQCNFDTLDLIVVSYGSFDASGINIDDMPEPCERCEDCLLCTKADCKQPNCTVKCFCEFNVDAMISTTTNTIIEAETFDNSGVVTNQAQIDHGRIPAGQYGVEVGNGQICIFGCDKGTTFTIKVYSEKAMTVDLKLNVACAGGYNVPNALAVTHNGASVTVPACDIAPSEGWHNWNEVSLGTLELTEGVNTIVITLISNDAPNFDKLIFVPKD